MAKYYNNLYREQYGFGSYLPIGFDEKYYPDPTEEIRALYDRIEYLSAKIPKPIKRSNEPAKWFTCPWCKKQSVGKYCDAFCEEQYTWSVEMEMNPPLK